MILKFELSLQEGDFLAKLSRRAICIYLKTRKKIDPPPDTPTILREKRGVFVTLNNIAHGRDLRGCIGYPLPLEPLVQATINSAIEAATGDPRFPEVSLHELQGEITIEVSVLTTPELIEVSNPLEYSRKVTVGSDGLIVERGWNKGLLLPQVPIEWNWDGEEFLSNCCMKAGLPPDAWMVGGVRISKFQAVIFEEESPSGKVRQKILQVQRNK